jgi:hypothetical protein
MHTIFWLQNLKGRDQLDDLGVDVKIIFERIFRKQVERERERESVWTACIGIRTRTSGG